MKKLSILAFLALTSLVVLTAATNYYGPPASPDAFGNCLLGPTWRSTSTTVSNIAIGGLAGSGLVNGSNNIYLGNTGNASDLGQVYIGTAGQQSNCTVAGTTTLLYSNTPNTVSSATANPGPVVVLQSYTNLASPSNVIQQVCGELDWSGTTAGTLLISNAGWTWPENAGTNQTMTFNGFAVGNSYSGTVCWYTVTNISFTVTNNGVNYGALAQNQAMFAGTSPPITPALVVGSAGWSYGLTPGNSAVQHVVWYGTLISKY